MRQILSPINDEGFDFERGVGAVLYIRCTKHHTVPQMNTCAACGADIAAPIVTPEAISGLAWREPDGRVYHYEHRPMRGEGGVA